MGDRVTAVCRVCGSATGRVVVELGRQPLANNLLTPADLHREEPRFPLGVFVCGTCWLVQLTDLIPPVELFSEYVYFSSFSDLMLRHAETAVARYCADYSLGPDSFVVEVASNDGYLLRNFVGRGIPCVGIEPALNVAEAARRNGVDTLSAFFGARTAAMVSGERGRAHLVLANNVFAHVPDMHDFVGGLSTLLAPQGTVVLEFPYLVDMIERLEFDTIYHEHVYYLALTPLIDVFHRHGLEIHRVERLAIHGGSLRVFAGHRGEHPIHGSVPATIASEAQLGVCQFGYYAAFAARVATLRDQLRTELHALKARGKRVAAYGAAAKGSTLLNYCGIGTETVDFVADRSPHKQGRLMPGVHIPIVAPSALIERADIALLLTWNFADEIRSQQAEFIARGGRFLVPLPEPRLL